MIRRLVVSNFRSLGEDVEFQPGALSVLVGPNGSGKSNVADVFRFLAESMRVGLETAVTRRHGIAALRRWAPGGRSLDLRILVEVELDGIDASYELILEGTETGGYRVKREAARVVRDTQAAVFELRDGKWLQQPDGLRLSVDLQNLVLPLVAGDDRFRPLVEQLRNMAVYAIFPDTLREPRPPDPTMPMDEHGANWASVLESNQQERWRPDLVAALGEVSGDIADIRVSLVGNYLATEFLHVQAGDKQQWLAAAQESDGTLRVAGILTALLQEPPPAVLGVEEPELTVHPGAIPLLYDHLREASLRSQVIVTTHSPDLLALLDPEMVWVVDRQDGITSVGPMEASQRRLVMERLLSLGDVLRMEGLRKEPAPPTRGATP